MTNIKIKEVEIYHPEKVVNNQFYIDHFRKQNKEIAHFLEVMGRKKRYIIDNPKENGLTMGLEAAKNVLKKSGLTSNDIDMIVFSTQTPEYTFPTNAMLIHQALQGKNETICVDSNSNCAGMVVAVEQTCRYMMGNPQVRYALVIGSDYNSINCNPNDEITYSNYGDASAAVILEKVEEKVGFIDSHYYSDSREARNVLFPAVGLSNLYKNDLQKTDVHIKWIPFDGTCCVEPAVAAMEGMMEKHNLTKKDIGAYCFSQFSYKNIELIQEELDENLDKMIYVGDEFGYTGTSSPFLALYRGIEQGKIKRGDHLFFWSVGTGWQICTMLFKF